MVDYRNRSAIDAVQPWEGSFTQRDPPAEYAPHRYLLPTHIDLNIHFDLKEHTILSNAVHTIVCNSPKATVLEFNAVGESLTY